MKHLARIFAILGFVFQWIIPAVLLSTVAALTKESAKAGLTSAGILATIVVGIAVLGKLKDGIQTMKNNIVKNALLSITPLSVWAAGCFGINYLEGFITDFSAYWFRILPFIIIGRLLYIVSGIFKNEQEEDEEDEKILAALERIKNNG